MPAAAQLDADNDVTLVSLRALRQQVCGVAARFEPADLSPADAGAAVREWSAIVNAAQTGLAIAAAQVETCGPPADAGASSAADFLAKTAGTTSTRAKETITRGQGMRGHPKTRQAAAAGELSPDQATAITDAVDVNPDAEDDLLGEAATGSLGQLRQRCAEKKGERQNLEHVEANIHARRCLRRYRDLDGAEHVHAVGTKRDLALLDQALKPLIEECFTRARRDGTREPLEAYTFDALILLAQRSLDGGSGEHPVGARRHDPIRHLSILRLDLPALIRGCTEPGETCEIAGLGPISVAAARDMLGQSVLKLVLTNGIDVRNVTHLGRGPTTAQKIAMLWEQPVCTRQGCGRRARLEYDHADGVEYRHTRHTRLDETDPLCHPDHHLKTNHGWALTTGTGTRPLVPPEHPRHPRNANGPGP